MIIEFNKNFYKDKLLVMECYNQRSKIKKITEEITMFCVKETGIYTFSRFENKALQTFTPNLIQPIRFRVWNNIKHDILVSVRGRLHDNII